MEHVREQALEQLCRRLSAGADRLDRPGAWPSEQLAACAEAGLFAWFVPPGVGRTGLEPC